ncbi:uncharacterized protein LOC111710122 isoform X2 [Eurytemora carolleeae]|uniref:uncharacterized protein LOC111710122 isoform X2 n=1 Tax=Eurytemora carolleeae TaxID=1294199 RepID=UPI000C76FB7F|nr:uncharacterized protein LOC111710122 isoform X2 [Eurytemora carolleeae]|eukprot:XP_023339925.1 uncharacterized protein LOC111710122 isoform X2 [Eurytemora affinis]
MLKHGYACSNPKEERSMAGSGGDEDLRRHENYEDEYIEQGRGSRSKMTYRYEDSSTTSTGSWSLMDTDEEIRTAKSVWNRTTDPCSDVSLAKERLSSKHGIKRRQKPTPVVPMPTGSSVAKDEKTKEAVILPKRSEVTDTKIQVPLIENI